MAETAARDSRIPEAGLTRIELRVCRRRGWRRVLSGAIVLAGLAGTLLSASAAGLAPSMPPVPVVNWEPCADPRQQDFDCATAQVPLDYGNPEGAMITLAVIRHLATDPANRLGALFFNPGGPGDPGTLQLPAWFGFFPAALRARFDIISWDPRGIGASTAVQCFADADEGQQVFAGLPGGFPVSRAEQRAWIRAYARFGQLCGERNGDLLAYVSTVDTAKDLDLLRQAIGDPQLDYLGVSYGTFLGATYANLFPDKVRAMVLDGNVDPVAWTNGGDDDAFLSTFLRLGSDKGSAKTLDAFLTLCGQASTAQCAFSAGSAAATKAKWTALLRRLRAHPVTIDNPPRRFTYAALVAAIGGDFSVLFFKALWPKAAELLQTLWTSPERSTLASAPDAEPPLGISTSDQGTFAVLCAESPNPRRPGVYPVLAALAYARAGDVGPAWVWRLDEPCASWPATAAHRYAGPWNRPTANPILVIGNIFDPATAYEGAVAMSHDLARARLLTVDGYGHTVLLNPSSCANDYESRYFVDGTLPPEGTVCRQDEPPFAGGASPPVSP